MRRPNTPLSDEQRNIIVEDYLAGEKLEVIKTEANVGSNKTIYDVLEREGIEPGRNKKKEKPFTPVTTVTFDADELTAKILSEVSPDNFSRYVCACIKLYAPPKHSY